MAQKILYIDNGQTAIYNGYSFRKDKKTGYFLSSVPIGKRRMRLHVYVWETETGLPLKRGHAIHHIDGNKDNNDVTNLQMLTNEEHAALHGGMYTFERRNQLAENLRTRAVPAAKAWHKSEAGREWHKEHGKAVFQNMPLKEYTCSNCGKKFETKNVYAKESNTFCSNNCRAAYRRKSGVDDVERTCLICGEKFQANKYSKAKYCEKHRRGRHTD